MNQTVSPTKALILLLAALTALTPLAIDAYLPAIPQMASDLATSIHDTEISLSLYLAGFAIGQIFGGPFSDHFGRRAATGSGLSIFCVGTLGIIFSQDIHSVWLFRVIQAIGGGVAVVNAAAVIRDLSHGKDSARHLSNMAVIMMLAPLLAPLIGMIILHLSGWRLIFVFLLVYGLSIGTALFLRLPETRKKATERTSMFKRYAMVLSHRCALGFIFSQCFALAGMFAFITGSPSVYMGYFDISETVYPFLFGLNVIGMMLANRLNIRLLHYYRPQFLLSLGQAAQVLTSLILLSYVSLATEPNLVIMVILLILFIASMGLIVSNATSSTVEFFPQNSATATALLGSIGFAAGALSGSLVGLLGDGTPWPMVIIMFACALIGPLVRTMLQYGQPSPTHNHS